MAIASRSNPRLRSKAAPVLETLLTLDEVARLLRVSRITVLRWVRARQLPAAKIGKSWRVTQTALNDWLRIRTTRVDRRRGLGWTREDVLDIRRRLAPFEEDWNAPGMDAYDDL